MKGGPEIRVRSECDVCSLWHLAMLTLDKAARRYESAARRFRLADVEGVSWNEDAADGALVN